jgi:hypothetical protein
MITSLNTSTNNNHSIKYDRKQLSSNTQLNFEENMSMLTTNNKHYREKENEDNDDDEEEEEDDDDDINETSKLVSIKTENNQEEEQQLQCEQQTSATTLRSILRKRTEKKMSTDGRRNVQQTSITIDENVNNDDEKDSDYTGDESEEEESNGSNKSIEEESKNNEQQHQRCRNYSRHQQGDQFFRTSPSTPLVFPLETTRTETGVIGTGTTTSPSKTFNGNDQSPSRLTCVTFTNDQPIIIHRSSSTPLLGGLDIQPRSSVTYINMKENISTSIPITTTGTSATLGSEFRPVYVSPLKYRPLVGLSANDSRLLLEKRVSLLGKPVVFHPIQKRSPSYRRTQLHIYNFLERPHGCKAVFYHTFV